MVESFWNKCMETYKLYSAHFLSTAELAWQAALKKAKVELKLLTKIDIISMVEKGTRGGICHSNCRYAEANNKYMKDHNINKKSSQHMYWDLNNLYGKAMSQKLPVDGF